MSETDTILETQTRHLLDVIERSRRERCETLVNEASERGREQIRQAHAKARQRMHQDIVTTRENLRRELASAQAQRETRLRHRRQQADRKLLEQAWQPLKDTLLRRWQRSTERRLWVAQLVEQALDRLLGRDWLIEHPADWPAAEIEELHAQLASRDVKVSFMPAEGTRAGLRVCAGNTCVDATLDGLLQDRGRIEAILLAQCNARRDGLAACLTEAAAPGPEESE